MEITWFSKNLAVLLISFYANRNWKIYLKLLLKIEDFDLFCFSLLFVTKIQILLAEWV